MIAACLVFDIYIFHLSIILVFGKAGKGKKRMGGGTEELNYDCTMWRLHTVLYHCLRQTIGNHFVDGWLSLLCVLQYY